MSRKLIVALLAVLGFSIAMPTSAMASVPGQHTVTDAHHHKKGHKKAKGEKAGKKHGGKKHKHHKGHHHKKQST